MGALARLATLIALPIVAALVAVSVGSSLSQIEAGVDCRLISPTPTATGTPHPTPPWMPFFSAAFCNDTGVSVSDLHIRLVYPAANDEPISVLGCPEPSYSYTGPDTGHYTAIHINWGEPCVLSGDSVYAYFATDCFTPAPGCWEPRIDCFYWTITGTLVPYVSPAVNWNRCSSPFPISPRPTPSPSPTPTPSPSPASTTPVLTPSSFVSTIITPASLPQSGGTPAAHELPWLWAIAGLAVTAASFVLAKRSLSR